MERQYNSHADAAAITISTTATVMPRQANCGIGRTYSRGGPPCTLSTCVGLRKNNRGRRSLRLKLEIDEGIAASLSQDDGAGHEGPRPCYNPARQTHHGRFDVAIAQGPVHENHPGGDKGDLHHFTRRKNGVAVRMSTKHTAQHSRSDGEIGCSKKYPCDANRSVSGKPGKESSREMARPRFVLEQSANNPFDDEIGTVKQAPNDKCPGRAVPEAAEKHDEDQIRPGTHRMDLVAAKRNIEVIAQECGERDMPAPPEIGKPNRRVRKTEIIFQMKTQAQRGADSASGIAREIKEYLAGECHHAQPRIHCDEWSSITKNAIGRTREHRIGEHDFFEQA